MFNVLTVKRDFLSITFFTWPFSNIRGDTSVKIWYHFAVLNVLIYGSCNGSRQTEGENLVIRICLNTLLFAIKSVVATPAVFCGERWMNFDSCVCVCVCVCVGWGGWKRGGSQGFSQENGGQTSPWKDAVVLQQLLQMWASKVWRWRGINLLVQPDTAMKGKGGNDERYAVPLLGSFSFSRKHCYAGLKGWMAIWSWSNYDGGWQWMNCNLWTEFN